MNTNHPMAAPSPCHGGDGARSTTEQSNNELTSNGQEDDGETGEVHQQPKPAGAGDDLNAVARGFNE